RRLRARHSPRLPWPRQGRQRFLCRLCRKGSLSSLGHCADDAKNTTDGVISRTLRPVLRGSGGMVAGTAVDSADDLAIAVLSVVCAKDPLTARFCTLWRSLFLRRHAHPCT